MLGAFSVAGALVPDEYEVMIKFYNSSSLPPPIDPINPCNWTGVLCTPDITHITNIIWENQPVSCSIPDNIANLTKLQKLILRDCNISGTLPRSLGNISAFKYIDVSFNPGISGTLPSELFSLSNMTIMYLNDCSLGGTIPEIKTPKLRAMFVGFVY
uniref:Leucine-rich repeat-containing N-terminal plant-type domain-containing protein n=1 Tax=Arcella intermedia TaxID=1963864 RepID=A0A6B2LN44_9EUKA